MFVMSPKTLSYALSHKQVMSQMMMIMTDQYIGLHLISPTHEGEIGRILFSSITADTEGSYPVFPFLKGRWG